ncbi:MAG: tryptophan synthase subunit alpha [Acidimicrobiia bacterium]
MLEDRLRSRRDAGHKLFAPFASAGLGPWQDVVRAYADAGADAIEIGVPFSDPVMDGPTIQLASDRALAAGTNLPAVLDELGRLDVEVPLVVMTYFNLVFHHGVERFAAEARDVGVAGVILPDVPLEEMAEWEPAASGAGLETVMLASPLTPNERLATLCARSRGFVYGVNLLGVTGERDELAAASVPLARRLKATTDLPVLMGFGISNPDQAARAAAESDGVVVASALVRLVLDGADAVEVGKRAAEFRSALDGLAGS